MTRYLRNKKVNFVGILTGIIFSIGVSLAVVLPNANATVSSDYYKNVFKELGINVDVLSDSRRFKDTSSANSSENISSSPTPSSVPTQVATKVQTYYLPKVSNPVLLIETSQLDPAFTQIKLLDVPSYKTIILICDSNYEFVSGVSCDYSKINVSSKYASNLFNLDTSEKMDFSTSSIFSYSQNNIRYIVFPENLIVDPKLSSNLTTYFKAVKRTVNIASGQSNSIVSTDDVANPILSKSLTEALFYMIPMFIFVAWVGFSLKRVFQDPRLLLSKDFYTASFLNASKQYQTLKPYFMFAFVMTILFYIPSLLVLSLLDKGTIALGSFSDYFIQSLNINNVISYLTTGNNMRTIFSVLSYLLLVSASYLLFPSVAQLFVIAVKRVFSLRLKEANIKNILYVLCGVVFTVLLLDPKLSFGLNTILGAVILIIYVFVLIRLQGLNFTYIVNTYLPKKERYIVLSTVFLFVCFWILRLTFLNTLSKNKNFETLIGVTDEVVMLPYAKSFTTDGFNEFTAAFDFPIFANNILLYDPKFSVIENKPIKDFGSLESSKENFMIVSYISPKNPADSSNSSSSTKDSNLTDSKYVKALLNQPELQSYVSVAQASRYFTISQKFSESFDAKYSIELTFDCTYAQKASQLKLNIYSSSEKSPDKTSFMNFPGCSKAENSSFKVTLRNADIFKEGKVFEIIDIEKYVVKDIKVYENGVPMKVQFLANPALNPVLYSSTNLEDAKVTVYSVGLDKAYLFDASKNISTNIESNFDSSIKTSASNISQNNSNLNSVSETSLESTTESTFENPEMLDTSTSKTSEYPKVNISTYLNTLISDRVLKEKFVLWSTKPNAVIRNDFDN